MKETSMNKIHENINNYYTTKIQTYGATPKGVDWNGEEGQFIRFEQLTKIINQDSFSINDIGCGYGKYSEYLKQYYKNFNYLGYDLSSDMIQHASQLFGKLKNNTFSIISTPNDMEISDYSVASGIFSVKMDHGEAEWLSYILHTIEIMNQKSLKGFAFNCLTKYSDKEYMRDDLYYADPLFLFDYCKRNFSKEVALLHDYDLYEFTILVRKDL